MKQLTLMQILQTLMILNLSSARLNYLEMQLLSLLLVQILQTLIILNLKSFKYKVKSLGKAVAQPAPYATNGILKNITVVVPLKYLTNFLRLFEMSLIHCKAELEPKWTKYWVLSVAGNENNIEQ